MYFELGNVLGVGGYFDEEFICDFYLYWINDDK